MEQLEATLLHDAFGTLPNYVKIIPADTDINTYSLFEIIDFGLTVRGTVGLELPCFGIPVITAGTGRYSGNGFTVDPKNVKEYRSILTDLHFHAPLTDGEINLARRYAFGSFFLRPKKVTFFDFDFHANDFNQPLFVANTYVWKAAGDAKDMDVIADWMVSNNEIDLLEWDELLNVVPMEQISKSIKSQEDRL